MKIDPNLFLAELCKHATPRKAQSLQLIYIICNEQATRGSRDYSIATIGALSSARGGPSSAAIRNKPGEDYRALIKAFAESVQGFSKKKREPENSDADRLLEGTHDPVLKARIRLMLAELTCLRGQLLAARSLANQNAVLTLDNDIRPVTPETMEGEKLLFTLQEVSALSDAISTSTMAHWGWTLDKAGRVTTESGQIVFRAGFGTALQKAIEFTTKT